MATKLEDTIMERIKNEKMYSKTHFQIISILLSLIIFIFLGLGVFSLTFFIWDSIHIANHTRINPSSVEDLLQFGLFELIILAAVASYGIYILFRKLDLPVAKHRLYVVIIVILLLVGLSIGASMAIDRFPPAQRFFDSAETDVQQLPHRRNRDRLLPPPPQNPPFVDNVPGQQQPPNQKQNHILYNF